MSDIKIRFFGELKAASGLNRSPLNLEHGLSATPKIEPALAKGLRQR